MSGTTRGVRVENETAGAEVSCEAVETALARRIGLSLRDLAARREVAFVAERVGSRIVAARVDHRPSCAPPPAVYQGEVWR